MACDEFRDRMLDVLYGEGDAAGAREFEAHQQDCADCRDELRALRGLRRDLREWTAPPLRSAARGDAVPRRRWLPLAAAIALGIAGGITLAASHSRIDALTAALREQDQRHRAEIAALQSGAASSATERAVTLEDVRRLIRESEGRQSLVLDASLRGLAERSDAQRREDLAQINAGLDYLEGRTGLQVARTTELMGHVLQASQKR